MLASVMHTKRVCARVRRRKYKSARTLLSLPTPSFERVVTADVVEIDDHRATPDVDLRTVELPAVDVIELSPPAVARIEGPEL